MHTCLKVLILFFSYTSLNFAAEKAIEKDVFPKHISLEFNDTQISLSRTGATVRKKFFFKVYKIAHYIDADCHYLSDVKEIYDTAIQRNCAKQISTVYLRSIKVEQIKEALQSGFELNANEDELKQIMPQINAFMAVITQDVEENDEFVLQRFPDGTIVSLFQGRVISTIQSENFARILWSIWFGQFSVVKRESLVEELLTGSNNE